MLIEFSVFSLHGFFLRKEEKSSYLSTSLLALSLNRTVSRDDFRLYVLLRTDFLTSISKNSAKWDMGQKLLKTIVNVN